MAVVTHPDNFTQPQYKRSRTILAILLLVGLLSLAGVHQIRKECWGEPQYLMLESGGYHLLESGEPLRLEQDRRHCWLSSSDFRLALPEWTEAIVE